MFKFKRLKATANSPAHGMEIKQQMRAKKTRTNTQHIYAQTHRHTYADIHTRSRSRSQHPLGHSDTELINVLSRAHQPVQ